MPICLQKIFSERLPALGFPQPNINNTWITWQSIGLDHSIIPAQPWPIRLEYEPCRTGRLSLLFEILNGDTLVDGIRHTERTKLAFTENHLRLNVVEVC